MFIRRYKETIFLHGSIRMLYYEFVPHWWHTLYEMNGCIHCIQSTSSILAMILKMICPDWPKSPVKFNNNTPYYIMKVALFRYIMFHQCMYFLREQIIAVLNNFSSSIFKWDIKTNSRNSSWNMYFTFVFNY